MLQDEHDAVSLFQVHLAVLLEMRFDDLERFHLLFDLLEFLLFDSLILHHWNLCRFGLILLGQVLLVEVQAVMDVRQAEVVDHAKLMLQQWVLVDCFPVYPFIGVNGQAFQDEINRVLAYLYLGREHWWTLLDFSQHLHVVYTWERVHTGKHFEVDHTQRPNVAFESVGFIFEQLRSHC